MSATIDSSRTLFIKHRTLYIFPVEVFTRKRGDIDVINAADVDTGLGEGDTFGVRLCAADFAKEVADLLLIELVFREILGAGEKFEFILVHEMEEHAFLCTVRTIALHHFGNVALKFVPNQSTMTSSRVFHVHSIHKKGRSYRSGLAFMMCRVP